MLASLGWHRLPQLRHHSVLIPQILRLLARVPVARDRKTLTAHIDDQFRPSAQRLHDWMCARDHVHQWPLQDRRLDLGLLGRFREHDRPGLSLGRNVPATEAEERNTRRHPFRTAAAMPPDLGIAISDPAPALDPCPDWRARAYLATP